jgi:DNA-binding response OmpR family regulator
MAHRIVVIEDDHSQSKPFIKLLEYRGYDVLHAYNGVDGIALIIRQKPDLVIVDLLLVKRGDSMDGYDVIQVLRNTSETEAVGILAWTSHFVERQDEIRALRAGADDFITKDAEYGLLEARIEALLRRIKRGRN